MKYKTSEQGIELLKEFEGVVPYEYLCSANKPTISKGIRTDLLKKDILEKYTKLVSTDTVEEIKLGVIIKKNEIDGMVRVVVPELENEFIQETLGKFEDSINELIKCEIEQSQFDSLVSLVYNIGISNFKKSTALKQINEGQNPTSWTRWNKVSGKVNKGLVERRRKEYILFTEKPY